MQLFHATNGGLFWSQRVDDKSAYLSKSNCGSFSCREVKLVDDQPVNNIK